MYIIETVSIDVQTRQNGGMIPTNGELSISLLSIQFHQLSPIKEEASPVTKQTFTSVFSSSK